MEEHSPYFDPNAGSPGSSRGRLAAVAGLLLCVLGLAGWLFIR